MLRHEDNIASRLGGNNLQPLAGISVTVTDNVTGLPASLYDDALGTVPLAQPRTTDENGYYGFNAPDGSYTLTFTGVRIAPFTRQIVLDDPKDNPYATKADLAAGSGAALVFHGTQTVAAELDALRTAVALDPFLFGGIGDGTSHPLSSRYATLAAAQSVYPFATALTQQIDWCAFVAMHRLANTTHQLCRYPAKNWYLIDPLEPVGTATAQLSTERGNFKIEGESMHNSVLIFNLTDDAQIGLEFVANSSGWDISNFRVKNLNPYYGTGIKFSGVYTSTVHNVHAFHFNIGVDKLSYVSTFTDVVGANCNCGFYDRGGGTSTINTSVYGASCQIQPGEVRTYDYLGCGVYITGGVYSKYVGGASDGNVTAYKVKTLDAISGSNPTLTLEFDNCGLEVCTNGFVIDAPQASVAIRKPSAYSISSGKLAHVENAIDVSISEFSDNSVHKVTLGANVGPGVVRIARGFSTGGNPSSFPLVNMPTVGGWGVDDFAYEGFAPLTSGAAGAGAAVPYAIGRMVTAKNQIEFELYARTNGTCASAIIDVSLLHNYSGANIDRAGVVRVNASNASAYIETGCISKTNANISVTETQIMDGSNVIGMRYLIKPFNGLASNATNSVALFRVETVFSPVGADGNGKNHNIKLAGTYTGRANCRLKGVDY